MALNFGGYTPQNGKSWIEKGTVVKAKIDFQRPSETKKQSGDSKCITVNPDTGAQYLNAKVTILGTLDGKYINKVFFHLIGLRAGDKSLEKARADLLASGWKANPNDPQGRGENEQLFEACNKWGNDGNLLLSQIIRSINDLESRDMSEAALAKMNVPDYEWFEGKEFVCVLGLDGVDKDGNVLKDDQGKEVEPQNKIGYVVLKDNKAKADDRAKLLGGKASTSNGFKPMSGSASNGFGGFSNTPKSWE